MSNKKQSMMAFWCIRELHTYYFVQNFSQIFLERQEISLSQEFNFIPERLSDFEGKKRFSNGHIQKLFCILSLVETKKVFLTFLLQLNTYLSDLQPNFTLTSCGQLPTPLPLTPNPFQESANRQGSRKNHAYSWVIQRFIGGFVGSSMATWPINPPAPSLHCH